VLEALEPRVLFSADVESVFLDPSFADNRDPYNSAIEVELPRDESAITEDLADVRHELTGHRVGEPAAICGLGRAGFVELLFGEMGGAQQNRTQLEGSLGLGCFTHGSSAASSETTTTDGSRP
jgi:hypothetical protein